MRWIIGGLSGSVLLIWWMMYYMGLLYTPRFSEELSAPCTLVYRSLQGEYKQSGKVMDEIYLGLKAQGIPASKGFSFYFDSPNRVRPENLRSIAGCVLEKMDESVRAKIPSQYSVRWFQPVRCIKAVFPFKNRTQVVAGIFKVYPNLERMAREKKVPYRVMEIYDMPARERVFYLPLQSEFDALLEYYQAK